LVVVEGEVAAHAFDRLRVLVFIEGPSRDIHLVRPLVAEVSAAVFPKPVPVVVEMILVEGALPGRPQPQIVIDAWRAGAVGLLAYSVARLEAEAARRVKLANAALVQELDRRLNGRVAAALQADRDDAVVLARGLDHLAAFPDVVRRRLLDVDVLACLAGPDSGERVPVVRGGDGDGVHTLVVEDAAQVGLGLALLFAAEVFQSFGEQPLVHVAERDNVDVRELGEFFVMGRAATADADNGELTMSFGLAAREVDFSQGLAIRPAAPALLRK